MPHPIAFIVLLALVVGCSTSKTPVTTSETTDTGAKRYEITIGSGGGVTGHVAGIHIDTTGAVSSWSSMPSQEATPEDLGQMSPERLDVLYTIIEEDSLMQFHHTSTGNMTSFLLLQDGSRSHRIRWSGIETDTVTAPIPLRRFLDAMNKSYKNIEKPDR